MAPQALGKCPLAAKHTPCDGTDPGIRQCGQRRRTARVVWIAGLEHVLQGPDQVRRATRCAREARTAEERQQHVQAVAREQLIASVAVE